MVFNMVLKALYGEGGLFQVSNECLIQEKKLVTSDIFKINQLINFCFFRAAPAAYGVSQARD